MLVLLLLNLLLLFRRVEISWLSNCVWARPQEPDSVRHTYTEYPGKTASCTRRWHRNNSTPPAQRLSWRARWQQAGCRQWMQHMVCQLVSTGMVPWYVVKWRLVSHVTSWWRKVPCEHAVAPCLGHCPLHTDGPVPILIGSSSSAVVSIDAGRVWGPAAAQSWFRVDSKRTCQTVSEKMEVDARSIFHILFSALAGRCV